MSSLTVIVVTLNRPACVRRCLDCLAAQTLVPEQIILVDASTDDRTGSIAREFSQVQYLKNPVGYGHMTLSRNVGLKLATGEVVAFIDDDSYAHPAWAENLLATYDDPSIGGVGGRALNHAPGEADVPVEEVGRLKPNGYLAANFAVDPGRVIAVDHVVGCNMSFRRDVLAELGGLRDDFPGTEVGEDTDISLRVRSLGYKVVFNPMAVVDHIAAPQAKGKRFDARYEYFHRRNNFVLLIRNFGLGPIVWRYLGKTSLHACRDAARKIGGALVRVSANFAGALAGLIVGTTMLLRNGRDPIRHDAAGNEIRAVLKQQATQAARPQTLQMQEI